MAKRLTEQHPLTKKVREVEQLCDKLGISIYNAGSMGLVIQEENLSVFYRDVDDGSPVTTFPHFSETKLVISE